jgi:hypothetical protein
MTGKTTVLRVGVVPGASAVAAFYTCGLPVACPTDKHTGRVGQGWIKMENYISLRAKSGHEIDVN